MPFTRDHLDELRALLGADAVLASEAALFTYESDEVQAVHVTIRGVAELLRERPEMNAAQRAVLAVERPDLYAPPG